MSVKLPGTTIDTEMNEPDVAEKILNNLFLGGGLVLSQVSQLTSLEPYIIQNWVKRGFLTSPVKKQYSKAQFSRIVIINMLKESLQLEKIVSLLSYINGDLDDTSDDLIDDSELYNRYVNLIVKIDGKEPTKKIIDAAVREAAEDYNEPVAGAKERLSDVLRVMAYAHCSAIMKQHAEKLLSEFKVSEN